MNRCPNCGIDIRSYARQIIINFLFDQQELGLLEDKVDEQTFDLVMKIYEFFDDKFRLTTHEAEAVDRLRASIKRFRTMDKDNHRNNIFKAANALGMKLPKGSF